MQSYNQSLDTIAKEENLQSLNGDDKFMFENKTAFQLLGMINKTRDALNKEGHFDLLVDDLIRSISYSVKFSIQNVIFYASHANNMAKEIATSPLGEKFPVYYQTMEDKRFFYYVDSAFEKLYNFLDRMGDILWLAFNLDIPEKEVYFGPVIKKLEKELDSSEYGKWLKEFYEDEYQQTLNYSRKDIVHYKQQGTNFFFKWLAINVDRPYDKERLQQLQDEKDNLPIILKKQLNLANLGFGKMVYFIKEEGFFEK